MPPTIHCVRHGQGLHNLGLGNYALPDPKMTELGVEQCEGVRNEHFPDQSHISLITASPLRRTIQSAFVVFQPALTSTTPPNSILLVPDAQETTDEPCDTPSDLDVLKKTCEQNHWPVDLSVVKDGFNVKKIGSRYSPSSKAIERRARDLRCFLREQARNLAASGDEDVHIVLVTHGSFLHYFTGDWETADTRPGTGWVNCETRAYHFEQGVDTDTDTDACLIESMDSRQGRGVDYPMFPKDKQRELYIRAMQEWEDQGLQNHSKVGLGLED